MSPQDEHTCSIAYPLIMATTRRFLPGFKLRYLRRSINREMKFDLLNGQTFLPSVKYFKKAYLSDSARSDYITECTALLVHAIWASDYEYRLTKES